MIVFKTLTIQNFLSYGNDSTTIDLNCDAPTLITGVNYDASVNGELDSNGCGKSSILNALSYALYNKTISINEKLDSLINNINKKDMLVILTFSKGGQDFRISRYRKNKAMGGEGVLIEKKKGKTWKDITSTKPEIQIAEEVLQIPYTVFNRIIGYAAGEEPFLKMGLPKQREVIDELFEYTELTKRADKVKDIMKGLKKDLEYARESNDNIKEESKRHKEQLKNVKESSETWLKNNENAIDKMQSELDKIESIDFEKEESILTQISEIEKDLTDVKASIKDYEKDISYMESVTQKFLGFDDENAKDIAKERCNLDALTLEDFDTDRENVALDAYSELADSAEQIRKTIHEETRDSKSLEKRISELDKELSHLDDAKCPYCLQKYEDAKDKIKELNSEKKKLNDTLTVQNKSIEENEDKLAQIEKKLQENKDSRVFETKEELNTYLNKLEKVKERIKQLEGAKNPHEDKSKEVKARKQDMVTAMETLSELRGNLKKLIDNFSFESSHELFTAKSKLDSLKERISEKKNENNPYTDMLNDLKSYEPKPNKDKEIVALERRITHCDFLIKLLTKKDSYLRKALMDKYLPLLNKRLHHYLNVMSLPHKVVFNSDLSTEISQFGQMIPYNNMSAGQRARINIALSLAFRDVLQSKHNFINLFILDECLDVGLSNVGVKKTVKAIKEVAKINKLSMFVISHRDEAKDSFPDKLEIGLKNGFSSII